MTRTPSIASNSNRPLRRGAVGPAVLFVALAASMTACAPDVVEQPESGDQVETTGLALTYDTLADTDVAGFQFTATAVDCATGLPIVPPSVFTAFEDLEDMYLPGTGMFAGAPLDAASQHLFSDHFFAVPAGCYDVTVQPMTADGTPSRDCAPATQFGVTVLDGETTEIMLISQCRSDETSGGLDVIAVLNHPPTITGLAYDPSKFICEDTTTVCVSVTDPDDDPITVVPGGSGAWTVIGMTEETVDGVYTACYTLQFPGPGDYSITFTAFDMAFDTSGVLVTMEDILAAQGTSLPSRDTLNVPVHVLPEEDCIQTCECPEGFEVTPAGDECVRITQTDVTINGTQYRVCDGQPSPAYGWAGAQFPGGLISTLAFFTGRLNTVGVWACDSTTGAAGFSPINEWIGFSVCLNVEEAGDYMVGIAGDNRVRFRLNGSPVFTLDSSATTNFNYWWMTPIALNSGLNIVELEGKNDGSIAAFGAEIYGPYAPGSTVSDVSMSALDYVNNVMWSTADVVGQPFITGELSGVSCPDGYALNACEGELTCTLIERKECM